MRQELEYRGTEQLDHLGICESEMLLVITLTYFRVGIKLTVCLGFKSDRIIFESVEYAVIVIEMASNY